MAERPGKPGNPDGERERLCVQKQSLRRRHEEVEQTIAAISSGFVDATVGANGTEPVRAQSMLTRAEFTRRLIDSVPMGVAVVDRGLRHLLANPAYQAIVGDSASSVVGRTIGQVFPPVVADLLERSVRQVFDRGMVVECHDHEATLQGQTWWNVTEVPLHDADGNVEAVIIMAQDVTERKLRQEELSKLNRTLRAMILSNQAILRADSEAEYARSICVSMTRDCGHAMAWVGYALNDEARTVQVIAHAGRENGYLRSVNVTWADTDRGRGPTGTAIRTGKVSIYNNMLTDPRFEPWRQEASRCGFASSIGIPLIKDGTPFGAITIYSSQPSAFSGEEIVLLTELAGDLAYGICSLRLRQARARAEADLAISETRYRSLVESIPALIWVADAQGAITDNNRALYEYTGLTHDQLRGHDWLKIIHPADAQRVEDLWDRSLRSGQDYSSEYRIRRACDGAYRWHSVQATLRKDQQGKPLAWFGTCMDIEDRKLAERQLKAARISAEKARFAAESASKAKDNFLAVLSHELRNPLNPVMVTVSILRHDPRFGDPETRELLDVIWRNVELEARLIDDMLDVTRIERGKIELHRRPIDLADVIRHAVEVCLPDIQARKLEFVIGVSDGPYLIDADAVRLQQVFWNLLKNAIKFTPVGGCVGVRCCRDGDFVVAEVTDSGDGIEPANLERIFNAFEQADRAITRQFGGLGLGLTISKALVELHGGTIHASSPGKGRGATFRVRMPLRSPTSAHAPDPAPPVALAAPVSTVCLRILLVEDHADTASVLARFLRMSGHRVDVAPDVATALQLAAGHGFDLLISDLGLPDGSGLDLLQTLRSRAFTFPALAMTGYGQETDIKQCRDAGFADHLTKPIDLERFQRAIAAIVSQSHSPSL